MKPAVEEPPPRIQGVHAAPRSEPPPPSLPRKKALIDFWFISFTHALVDIFPIYFTALFIVLDQRLDMTRAQESAVLIATPIFSGMFQPLFAWLGDRFDTRMPGPLGLAIGAICISSIGFAQTFWQLILLQIVGVIGTGMYHPTATATAGQMGGRGFRNGRALAVSVFIAAGMVGHTVGPIISTRMNAAFGLESLFWIMPPTLVIAVILYFVMRDAPHRPSDHHERRSALTAHQAKLRWIAALLLTLQNSMRYCVNIGMFILFNYWAKAQIPDDAARAASLNGNLSAAMTLGMGVGAVFIGRFVRQGMEKSLFAITAFGGALFIGLINVAGDWGGSVLPGSWAYLPAYAAAFLGAVGFFAPIPSSIGLGQRLLPSHSSLVTSLLMGVGWMAGALSRPISSALLGWVELDDAGDLTPATLNLAFMGFGAILVVVGLLAISMPSAAIREVADHE